MSGIDLKNGERCKKCSADSRKPDIEVIRNFFTNAGYELLENEYVGSTASMKYMCPKHGVKTTKWSRFKKGVYCYDCYLEKIKPSIEHVKNEFQKKGFELLSDNYVNAHTKLNYLTSDGIEKRYLGITSDS